MSYTIDSDHWPILILDFSPQSDDKELQRYVAELGHVMDEAVAQNRRCVAIVPGDRKTSASERSRIAAAHRALTTEQTSVVALSVMVTSDPLVRGALTALMWLLPRKLSPVVFVPSAEEACSRAFAELDRLGLPRPAQVRSLRRRLGIVSPAQQA